MNLIGYHPGYRSRELSATTGERLIRGCHTAGSSSTHGSVGGNKICTTFQCRNLYLYDK